MISPYRVAMNDTLILRRNIDSLTDAATPDHIQEHKRLLASAISSTMRYEDASRLLDDIRRLERCALLLGEDYSEAGTRALTDMLTKGLTLLNANLAMQNPSLELGCVYVAANTGWSYHMLDERGVSDASIADIVIPETKTTVRDYITQEHIVPKIIDEAERYGLMLWTRVQQKQADIVTITNISRNYATYKELWHCVAKLGDILAESVPDWEQMESRLFFPMLEKKVTTLVAGQEP